MVKKDLCEIIKNMSFIPKEFILDNCGSSFFYDDERRDIIEKVEEHNRNLLQKIKGEIAEYTKVPQKKATTPSTPRKETISEKDDELIDISYYQNLFQSCPSDDQIPLFLPKRKNKDFELIINLLIKNILIEIDSIEKFIIEEKLNSEMKTDFLEEATRLRNKIDLLVQYRDKKTNVQTEEIESFNKLIYLQTTSGNYYVLNDMKAIDVDYYSSFLELLQSIKDGTLKNIKGFNNNGKLDEMFEVKNFKTRIVFKRLTSNIYIIISMFMKKVDTDLSYFEYLKNRSFVLQQSMPQIREKLSDPEYLLENDRVTSELEMILKKDKGVKNGRS